MDFEGRVVLSIDDAATKVGVSRRTINNWMRRGKIELIRTAGGSVRIFEDTLWQSPHHKVEVQHYTFAESPRTCSNYARPDNVLGGPCVNCGASQPEHYTIEGHNATR